MDRFERHSPRAVLGVATAIALLLVYGAYRPESLEFSIPFLIAPSMVVLGGAAAVDRSRRRLLGWVVAAIVIVTITILLLGRVGHR